MRPPLTTPRAGRVAVITGFAALGTFWGMWGAVVPEVKRHAHVSNGQLGGALLLIGVGALVSMRVTGAVIDRWGTRVTGPTIVLLALAALPLPSAASPVALSVALFLVGVASGAVDVAINGSGVEEEFLSGPLMSLAHAGFSAAVVVFSLLAGAALGAGASLAAVVYSTAGVVLVAAGLVAWMRPGERRLLPRAESTGRLGLPAVLLLLGVLCGLSFLVESVWQSWGAVHLETVLGQGPTVGALAPALFAAAATVGRLSCQGLVRRGHTYEGLISGGAVMAAVGSAIAAFAPDATVALGGITVAGLGTSVGAPLLFSLAGRHTGAAHRAGAVSLVTTFGYLGFLIGPALVGLVASVATLRIGLLVAAVAAGALAAATVAARSTMRRG